MAVPIYVKGGSWTQTEDQILKAAITKYGLQKWNKIASLLIKKTASQCKQRWEEYLNPMLNFSSFTVTEDNKLLELAKYYPNQWRTIADVMGRTAQMCNDHYNYLISKMMDEPLSLSPSSTDSNRLAATTNYALKVGEVNPNNETLPAKPSLVSFSDKLKGQQLSPGGSGVDQSLIDDEREMIADAKARLMNTQGKKASRKVRERMLEDSKKIAMIQKRRELKQAGIITKLKPPKKTKYDNDIDYNAEVVYEHKPLPGRYDITGEELRDEQEKKNFEKRVEREGLKRTLFEEEKIKSRDLDDDDDLNKDDRANKKQKLNEQQKQKVYNKPISGIENAVNDFNKPVLNFQDLEKSIQNESSVHLKQSELLEKRKLVQSLLSKLPKPLNDFEIVIDPSSTSELADPLPKSSEDTNKKSDRNQSEQEILSFYTQLAETEIMEYINMNTERANIQHIDTVDQIINRDTRPYNEQMSDLDNKLEDIKCEVNRLKRLHAYISSEPSAQTNGLLNKVAKALRPSLVSSTTTYRNKYYEYSNEMKAIETRKSKLLSDIKFAKN